MVPYSSSGVIQVTATLFCCEAPEMLCRLGNFTWHSISMGVSRWLLNFPEQFLKKKKKDTIAESTHAELFGVNFSACSHKWIFNIKRDRHSVSTYGIQLGRSITEQRKDKPNNTSTDSEYAWLTPPALWHCSLHYHFWNTVWINVQWFPSRRLPICLIKRRQPNQGLLDKSYS